MWRRIVLSALFIGLLFISGPASAARIIVTIDGLHSAQGNVYVGLYSNARDFLNGTRCDRYFKVKASMAPITVAFDRLPPGSYAVGAFHDENGNNRLDTNALGLPVEGYALSNGVRAVLAKPEFYQAEFTVGQEDKPVTLRITY